jgi:hypothetical protein
MTLSNYEFLRLGEAAQLVLIICSFLVDRIDLATLSAVGMVYAHLKAEAAKGEDA